MPLVGTTSRSFLLMGHRGHRELSISILELWGVMKNVALSLLTLVFIGISILTILRTKLGGAAITLVSTIPNILAGLLAIVFSYPIVGLTIDLSNLVNNLIIWTFFSSGDFINQNVVKNYYLTNKALLSASDYQAGGTRCQNTNLPFYDSNVQKQVYPNFLSTYPLNPYSMLGTGEIPERHRWKEDVCEIEDLNTHQRVWKEIHYSTYHVGRLIIPILNIKEWLVTYPITAPLPKNRSQQGCFCQDDMEKTIVERAQNKEALIVKLLEKNSISPSDVASYAVDTPCSGITQLQGTHGYKLVCPFHLGGIFNPPTGSALLDEGSRALMGILTSIIGLIIPIFIAIIIIKIDLMLVTNFIWIIVNTIFAPIRLLSMITSGTQSFVSWLMDVVARVAIYPVTFGLIFLASIIAAPRGDVFTILHIPLHTNSPFAINPDALPSFGRAGPRILVDSFYAPLFHKIIAAGIVVILPQLKDIVLQVFKRTDLLQPYIEKGIGTFRSIGGRIPIIRDIMGLVGL